MRRIYLVLVLSFITLSSFAQQKIWTQKSIIWQEKERFYKEFIPNTGSAEQSGTIVFVLHGLGGGMNDFDNTKLVELAEEKAWIVVAPEALEGKIEVPPFGEYSVGKAWNSGAGQKDINVGYILSVDEIHPNKDIDDIGFLLKLVQDYKTEYTIDEDKVFFMGFSMGGFMCHKMAIEAGDKIAAIATISGTVGHFQEFNPLQKINILHIHGTDDAVVGYQNADLTFPPAFVINDIGLGAEETVRKWRAFNHCDIIPEIYSYPSIANDEIDFTRYTYFDSKDTVVTEFIKANGGEHRLYYTPEYDIDYFVEIFNFFSKVRKVKLQIKED